METDYGYKPQDAEVVIAAACLLHDIGMSIHRIDHESYSLFIASGHLESLLAGIYDEPDRTVIASEAMHAVIGHRQGGAPLTLEAGVVRVADALDMEHGRTRVAMETQLPNIHSLSAAAIDEVRIVAGEQRTIRVEIEMNNSAGVFQLDELLASKLRGSGLEDHVEVVAPDRRGAREAPPARVPNLSGSHRARRRCATLPARMIDRRTKIVATLGPATDAPEVLDRSSRPAWTAPG